MTSLLSRVAQPTSRKKLILTIVLVKKYLRFKHLGLAHPVRSTNTKAPTRKIVQMNTKGLGPNSLIETRALIVGYS